jgi:PAS domain S-box-containing protein
MNGRFTCWHDFFRVHALTTSSIPLKDLVAITSLNQYFCNNARSMAPDVNDHSVVTGKLVHDHKALTNLIDSIPALVASIDCNMAVQFANRPFRKWFSVDHDVSGASFSVLVGKQVFNQVQRHLGKVLVGSSAQFQIAIPSERDFHYLDVNLSPEFDNKSEVKGFIFHSADITEKLNTQRALKDYFENASIGLHWVNAEGIIVWANPAELAMLGYTEQEYIGHNIAKFHADKNGIDEILRRLKCNDVLQNYEAELICKDGSTRYVAINSSVLWEGDRFIHTRCFTIDITAQKLAAKAVTASEERFKMMANLVPLVIWTTDEKGYCNFLSVRWKEITGKNMEDGLGNQWLEMVHPSDRDNIRQSWSNSLSKRNPFEAKFRYLNAKGEYCVNYANSIPIHGVSGEFMGYIGILQDISSQEQIKSSLEKIVLERTEDLRRRNAQLKFAEKALKHKNLELEKINNELSSFAHVASHDLQEPLRKIQTFSNRVLELEGDKFSDRGKDLFHRIETASYRMRSLIQDLLAYSKTNDVEGKFELIDLNQILQEVVNELEIKIEEKNASIENLGLPKLNVVKFQIHQLLLNLLSNALKFSKINMRPQIVVKSECVRGDLISDNLADIGKYYYHISVSDNGIGFEPDFNEKIFEIFHRLHGKTEFEGTGIGLAICKKIMENHKGIITAEGKPSEGATFHIYLPSIE